MKLCVNNIRKWAVFAQFAMCVMWASHLIYTDSYFSIYALCSAFAVYCLCDNYHCGRKMQRIPMVLNLTLSSLLSLAAALANYPIFQRLRNMKEISAGTNAFLNLLEAGLTFVCGIVVFYQIFLWLAGKYPEECDAEKHAFSGKYPGRVFTLVFGLLSLIYLVYLFFVVYPGNVTSDSIWQICMIADNNYTNHHPYWHTVTIGLFMSIGGWLFGDANAAAATYSVFQSLIMAATFAYAVVTLYQYRVPKGWVILTFAAFAFLPHHITYSCTVWKDVPFGAAVLILVVSMFRIMRGVGKSRVLNYVLFAVGGIGTGIMRSNGLAAMIAAFLILALFFRKRCRQLLLPWLGAIVICWAMTGPVLDALNVSSVNFIEGLSVPLQQVARAITNGGDLTEEETEKISRLLDIEQVPQMYNEECVDAIKDMIGYKERIYLEENKGEYLKVWLDIGLRYPWEYVEAWVEETKGYWNGGYEYYIYAQYVSENEFGMYMVEQNNLIHDLMKAYFTLTRETVFFEPIQSVGLNIWVLSMLCFLNMVRGRREFLLTMPVLAVVFTLWLTTPVFCEYRYAYSIFTTMPFLLPVSLTCHAGEEP